MNADFLQTIATRIVPGLQRLDDQARTRIVADVLRAVGSRPARLRRQLDLFLEVVRWLPAARYGRPFERLTTAQQDAVLRWFMDAPFARLRQGFWGVKTLVYLGYYGQPEVSERIGYRPSRNGNALLGK